MFKVGDTVICICADDNIELGLTLSKYLVLNQKYKILEIYSGDVPQYKDSVRIAHSYNYRFWFLSKNFAHVDSPAAIANDILSGRI